MARKKYNEDEIRAEIAVARRVANRLEEENAEPKIRKKQPERLNKLKEVLASKKMTQQALANKAEIGFASINMYYNGKREPSLETLKSIAKALGVSGKDLINF